MKNLFCFIGLLLVFGLKSQTESVLANGKWAKIEINESGVYKITPSLLSTMGFNTQSIDPRNLVIYGAPEGMLPQANNANWPINLVQIPVQVLGESDGRFDASDYLLFYATSADKLRFDTEDNKYLFEKNLYAESAFYFVSVSNEPGLRIENQNDLGRGFPAYTTHRKVITHELDETNLLSSGREWFGERMTNNELSFQFNDAQIISGDGQINIQAIAQSLSSSSISVNANGSTIGELAFSSIPSQQYAIKANKQSASYRFNSVANEISIVLNYNRNGSNSAISYLDHLVIEAPATNQYSQPFLLSNPNTLNQSISEFQINAANQLHIWDVSSSTAPKRQETVHTDGIFTFSTFTDALKFFWVFDSNAAPEPTKFELIDNQNLQGASVPELIIISNNQFLKQAHEMADFRRSHDNMHVLVVDVGQIYNEYGGGRQDVSAIRNFIKQKFDQSTDLRYVMFLGKGSYDYKNRLTNNTNFVPTYESRNSIHPLFTFSSDDYFGFLEDHEGQWEESRAGDHTLDIGIGRIPVTSPQEADQFLEKWLTYQSNDGTLGVWRTKVGFVADDGDRNIHQRDAEILANTVDQNHGKFNLSKLYLDAFPQEKLPGGEKSILAEKALLDAVNNGTLLINFTGHGAESGWMQERILTFDLMEQWDNPEKLPFLVTATCEFGRNDDPLIVSGAEFLINKAQSGAIGLVTTARPVFSSTNFSLNQALYDVILAQENGAYHRLGDIIQYTKNNSLEGSLNRNFILLGDPSLRLNYPQQNIELTELNDLKITDRDTISAFEQFTIKGEIKNGATIDHTFNGLINYKFLDKPGQKKTFGTESDVFSFKEKDRVLAKGIASVESGIFRLTLQVPQNIDYSFGQARFEFYATDSIQQIDAMGVNEALIIGGTSPSSISDKTPPKGQLFLNDINETNIKSYSSSVLFIAQLEDESGINISNNALGQNIVLSINDSISINLNSAFSYFLDKSDKGEIRYNLENLPPGQNLLRLKFWDNAGNPNESEIAFRVEENSSLINEIKNFPNPLKDETQFVISHKLAGEDLDIKIDILNMNGQPITSLNGRFNDADSEIRLLWTARNNWGTHLEKGVYIYNIQLSSRNSGLKDSKRKKLVISH